MGVSGKGAGPMRDRVAFDAPISSPDGRGGVETAWEEQFERFVEVIYQRGSEGIEGARLSGRSSYKIRLRQSASARQITTDWRLRDLKRTMPDGNGGTKPVEYNLREVDAITDRQYIWLVAESGVAI